jgi:hypothetical protein
MFLPVSEEEKGVKVLSKKVMVPILEKVGGWKGQLTFAYKITSVSIFSHTLL